MCSCRTRVSAAQLLHSELYWSAFQSPHNGTSSDRVDREHSQLLSHLLITISYCNLSLADAISSGVGEAVFKKASEQPCISVLADPKYWKVIKALFLLPLPTSKTMQCQEFRKKKKIKKLCKRTFKRNQSDFQLSLTSKKHASQTSKLYNHKVQEFTSL